MKKRFRQKQEKTDGWIGLGGNYSTLLTKGILDLIIICVMTASGNRGCSYMGIFTTVNRMVFG